MGQKKRHTVCYIFIIMFSNNLTQYRFRTCLCSQINDDDDKNICIATSSNSSRIMRAGVAVCRWLGLLGYRGTMCFSPQVSNVLDSLIAAGRFQIVGAKKLRERLQNNALIMGLQHNKVRDIYIPPLTGKPEQQRFTIRSGVLASTSSRRRGAIGGHDRQTHLCPSQPHCGLHPAMFSGNNSLF